MPSDLADNRSAQHLDPDCSNRECYVDSPAVFPHTSESGLLHHFHSPNEAREASHIEAIFRAFDSDGSDSIDREELAEALRSIGFELQPEQLQDLLDQVSEHSSTAINLEQFARAIHIWKDANRFKILSGTGSLQEQRISDTIRSRTHLSLPDDWIVVGWQLAVAFLFVLDWFLVGYLIASRLSDSRTFDHVVRHWATVTIGCISSITFAVDIVVTLRVSHRIAYDGPLKTRFVDSTRTRVFQYARTPYLWCDIAAAIPLHLFLSPTTPVFYLSSVRVLKIATISWSFFRRSGMMRTTPAYVYVQFYVVPFVRVVLTAAFALHTFAVLWTVIASHTQTRHIVSWTYPESMLFVLSTVTTTGYQGVAAEGNLLLIFVAVLLCVGATVLNGVIVGTIVSSLSRTDIQRERETKLRETLAVCEHFDVPEALKNEVLSYQDYVLRTNLGTTYRDLVAGLPGDMQSNLSLFTRYDLVKLAGAFNDSHRSVKVAVAERLDSSCWPPEAFVVRADSRDDHMYFAGYGYLDVLDSRGSVTEALRAGDSFGKDLLLLNRSTHPFSLRAVTYCNLLRLSRVSFDGILFRFPRFRRNVLQRRALAARMGHIPSPKLLRSNNPESGGAAFTSVARKEDKNYVVNSTTVHQARVLVPSISPTGEFAAEKNANTIEDCIRDVVAMCEEQYVLLGQYSP